MALLFTPNKSSAAADRHAIGDMWVLIGTLTFSGSYATGGDTVDLTRYLLGTSGAKFILPLSDLRGNGMEYDLVNKKLKLYSAANTEVAAAAYNAALTGSPVPVAFMVY